MVNCSIAACIAALAAAACTSAAAAEDAPLGKRCSLIGTWTNMGGYQYVMTHKKRGTYTPPGCTGTINLRITKKNHAGFHVIATGAGEGCGSFTEDMAWQGSCTYASGTFTEGGYTGPDGWTYAGPPARNAE